MKKLLWAGLVLTVGLSLTQAGISINIGIPLPPLPPLPRPAIVVHRPVAVCPPPVIVAPPRCPPRVVITMPPPAYHYHQSHPRYGHQGHGRPSHSTHPGRSYGHRR